MAVEKQRIKDAIRKLFPNVNLSTARLDELSAGLSQQPADDADEATVEAEVNKFNAVMPFQKIAADDDRTRNLLNKTKAEGGGGNPPNNPPAGGAGTGGTGTSGAGNEATDEERRIAAIVAAAMKPLTDKISVLEQSQQGFTTAQKLDALKIAAKEKQIPDFLLENVQIGDDYNQDTVLNNLSTKWTEIRQQHFNSTPGYTPPNPTNPPAGGSKTIHPAVKRLQVKASQTKTS